MIRQSFYVCGITTTGSSKVRNESFYKSCMENANKELQNDEEEDELFVLWFYTVISLGSLKKKKQKLKKKFIYFWVIYIMHTIMYNPHYN